MMEPFTKEHYIESLFAPDDQLAEVKHTIREHKMPEISIAPGYGRLLTILVKMSGAQHVLEIGALGGYSGLCLARGLGPAGQLLSLDISAPFAGVAKHNLTQAGFGEQVEYRIGEALVHLNELVAQGMLFDFVFIDADKVNYPNYLDMALQLARPGTIIVGDNTFMNGQTLDPEEQKKAVQAMRAFNERIATDTRLDSTILPAYDGLAIARVKA
jgi:caffeoyl-CoA O-methyltransferase